MPLSGGINTQVGLAEETTPGTGVVVTRFFELDPSGESVKQDIDRIEFQGLRSGGRRSLGSQNWVAGKVGIAGDLTFPVMTKGFGIVFKNCLGTNTTTTPGGATLTRDHKATEGPTDGRAWTLQLGRTDATGTTTPFTYAGVKITSWELSNDTSGMLMVKLSVDGMSETTATGLASASYPTGILPFSYVAGSLTLGGSAFDVKDWSLSCDNGLATDRYFIRATTPASKKEQLEGGKPREYTGSLTAEWSGLTAYNRFVNGTTAALVVTYASPVAIEGTFFPTITISAPVVRFDGETPTVSGPELLDQPLPFKLLNDSSTDAPVAITTRNADATA